MTIADPTRTGFPSPFEVAIPPECRGWEEMYAEHVVFGEDKAAVRAEMRGTHSADFFGIAATGKSYAIRLHEFHTFEGSQIAYTWHMEDWFGFLNQIGAWPVTSEGDEQ